MAALVVSLIQPGAASASTPAAKHRPKIVYFTFDDGPNSLNSPRLLKILAREEVPATFFLVGQSLAADPGAATRLWLGGHAVGNHTWSHADLTHLSTTQVAAQLRSNQRLLGPGGGACMRPPYGATNAAVAAVVAHEMGHVHHRHGLRQLIQSSAIAVVVGLWIGDFDSMLTVASTVLLGSAYSREFEYEADGHGAQIVALPRPAGAGYPVRPGAS